MNRLLIIADDLTGALDTGVCFASAGIQTCVRLPGSAKQQSDNDSAVVEVAIVESRHMQPEEAYDAVYETIAREQERYTYLYKKTDSALRGNVGAELSAMLDATGKETLHFLPSFPKMNRILRNGILFIDGETPVASSVFAQDPFNPVRHSDVLTLIAEQTQKHAYLASDREQAVSNGIAIYNAETDEELRRIGAHLVRDIQATLFAGCAGFASVLPELIDFETSTESAPHSGGKIAVFCGSVNPISLEQCTVAEQEGYPRFHLQREGRFVPEETVTNAVHQAAQGHDIVILDTGAEELCAEDDEVLAQSAVVAEKFSKVISNFFTHNPHVTLFVIGGDTLLAFARRMGIHAIYPIKEIMPGVVLSRFRHQGEWHSLITKSGGFGGRHLLTDILNEMIGMDAGSR